MQLFEVVDRLDQARIYPMFCDKSKPACGRQPESEGNACSERPCEKNRKDGHLFPVAQCILDGELYLQAISFLGLLQTLIHYGMHTDRGYRFSHLGEKDGGPGLQLPWLKPGPGEAQVDNDLRKRLEPTFVYLREEQHVSEFVNALESEDHVELHGPSGRDSPQHILEIGDLGKPDQYRLKLPRISKQEMLLHFVLVPDAEQSFFCLLMVLSEANAHARELTTSEADGIELLRTWVSGTGMLRSVLADEMETNSETVSAKDVWREETFEDAVLALGFIEKETHPNCIVISPRYRRLCQWLAPTARDSESSAIDNCPAMQLEVFVDNKPATLRDVIHQVLIQQDSASSDGPDGGQFNAMQSLCHTLLGRLQHVYYRKDRNGHDQQGQQDDAPFVELIGSAGTLTAFPLRRFNIAGEYRLRKGETISRNYFATALLYLKEDNNNIQVGAYALGTLHDLESINGISVTRLHALRSLLRTLSTFGTEYEWQRLLKARRNEGQVHAAHHISYAVAVAIKQLNAHAEQCPSFKVPVELYLAAMRAAIEAMPNEELQMKAMIRLQDIEDAIHTDGLTAQIIESMCNIRTGIARRLAQSRLRQTAKSVSDTFPEPRVEVNVEAGLKPGLEKFETSLFIAVLVLLLKEALEHASLYNKAHCSQDPVIVQAKLHDGKIRITIENACVSNATWDEATSNSANDQKTFLRFLRAWDVAPPVVSDHRWRVEFYQK